MFDYYKYAGVSRALSLKSVYVICVVDVIALNNDV